MTALANARPLGPRPDFTEGPNEYFSRPADEGNVSQVVPCSSTGNATSLDAECTVHLVRADENRRKSEPKRLHESIYLYLERSFPAALAYS